MPRTPSSERDGGTATPIVTVARLRSVADDAVVWDRGLLRTCGWPRISDSAEVELLHIMYEALATSIGTRVFVSMSEEDVDIFMELTRLGKAAEAMRFLQENAPGHNATSKLEIDRLLKWMRALAPVARDFVGGQDLRAEDE
jgi:hypothetical protein